jgi:hypothetical protein
MGKKKSGIRNDVIKDCRALVHRDTSINNIIFVLPSAKEKKSNHMLICTIIFSVLGAVASACTIAAYIQNRYSHLPDQRSTHSDIPSTGRASEKQNISEQSPGIRTHARDNGPRNLALLPVKVSIERELNSDKLTNLPIKSSLYDAFSNQMIDQTKNTRPESVNIVTPTSPSNVLPQIDMKAKESGQSYSTVTPNIEPGVLVHKAETQTCFSADGNVQPCPEEQ